MFSRLLRLGLCLLVEGPAQRRAVLSFFRPQLDCGAQELDRLLKCALSQQNLAFAVERLGLGNSFGLMRLVARRIGIIVATCLWI